MHIKTIAPISIALLLATGGYSAFALENEAATEAAALGAVSVTMSEAITTVEAKKTGVVVEAALLTEGATSVYHLTTLMPDGTETNYAVDAKTGAVVATVDVADNEGDGSEGQDDGQGGDGDGETQDDGVN